MIGNVLSNNYDEYKSNGDRNKALPIKEYIGNIKPYLKNIINNLKKTDARKIYLTIAISFTSLKDVETLNELKSRLVKKQMKLYKKHLNHYFQIGLEESKNGRNFVFDFIDF